MSTKKIQHSKKNIHPLIQIQKVSNKTRKQLYEGSGYTRTYWQRLLAQNRIPRFGRLEGIRKASGLSKQVFYDIINKHLLG